MERSLYERLGGVDGITAAIRAVEDRSVKDDRISQKFAQTDMDRLTMELVDKLCDITGGPCTYTGRDMRAAHANMGLTNGEFDAFMEDLGAVLDGFKIGKTEQEEVLGLLWPLRTEIVEVDSSQVGTPLPSTFVPAPAL